MKKHLHLLVCVAAMIIALGVFGYTVALRQQQPTNTNSAVNARNTNTTTPDDPVEYSESYGTTCPLDVHFLKSRTSPSVDCQCPEGYAFNSRIIGGEECYDGAECPILSVTCEAE